MRLCETERVRAVRVVDSDGDEMPDDGEQDPVSGYRVWFALDINVLPAAPEQELELACACQVRARTHTHARTHTRTHARSHLGECHTRHTHASESGSRQVGGVHSK